jgi:hypothetical protein
VESKSYAIAISGQAAKHMGWLSLERQLSNSQGDQIKQVLLHTRHTTCLASAML